MSVAIWLAVLMAVLGSVLAALQHALRDFSLRKLELLAGRNGGLDRLGPIIESPERHALSLGAVRVLVNVVLVLSILWAFAGGRTGDDLVLSVPAMLWAAIVSALALYVFGMVLPLSLAEHAGEKLIHTGAGPIRLIHVLAFPIRPLHVVDEAIRRLTGVADVTEKEELEEELMDVVIEGEREGSLGQAERNMIKAVVEMNEITTEEIMTPRTEIEGLDCADDLLAIREFIAKAGHSRIPVFEGDLDHILGILYAKDLLAWLGEDVGSFRLRPMLREAIFVPEVKPVSELLIEMQTRKVHLAIVLDEYGGTTGLVTLEDVVEEVVGEIEDEYEPADETPPVIEVSAETRSAEIEARAYIKDANEKLEPIGVELPEHDDYDTVGGYVLHALGHIPAVGETFRQNGHMVEVLEAEPTRVTRLRVEAREAEAEAEDAEPVEPREEAREG
jgi:putative hemolysin